MKEACNMFCDLQCLKPDTRGLFTMEIIFHWGTVGVGGREVKLLQVVSD